MSDTPALPPPFEADDPLERPQPPRSWRARAEHLADATGTTPTRILVGAIAVALAIGLALWLTRPAAAPPEVSLPFASGSSGPRGSAGSSTGAGASSGSAGTSAAEAPATSTSEATEVVVDIEGAVQQPGVHHLPAGARVTDAVVAAGGLGPNADGARLNLAAVLQDGQRVYVPAVGEQPPPVMAQGSSTESPADGAPAAPVDLNTADQAALDALPGIGPATAAAIIQHRQQIGGYTSVDQLLDVRGIGPAKLDQIRSLVTV